MFPTAAGKCIAFVILTDDTAGKNFAMYLGLTQNKPGFVAIQRPAKTDFSCPKPVRPEQVPFVPNRSVRPE